MGREEFGDKILDHFNVFYFNREQITGRGNEIKKKVMVGDEKNHGDGKNSVERENWSIFKFYLINLHEQALFKPLYKY